MLTARPVLVRSALERVQPRVVSFEEQVTVIREALAALHEREEEYTLAAQILAGIDLDSGAHLFGNLAWQEHGHMNGGRRVRRV